MNPTRIRMSAVVLAAAALSTAAGAQTYTFSRTELGRVVPARFATTTQALLASVDVAASAPVITTPAASADNDLLTAVLVDGVPVTLASSNENADADDADKNTDEASFFSSTMGRASMLGLAGLAGASYYALRADDTAAAQLSYTLAKGPTVIAGSPIASLPVAPTDVIVNPEPGTIVLMLTGLGALGIVARRRRSN